MKHAKLLSLLLISTMAFSTPIYASETEGSSTGSEAEELTGENLNVHSTEQKSAEELKESSQVPEAAQDATVTPTPTEAPTPADPEADAEALEVNASAVQENTETGEAEGTQENAAEAAEGEEGSSETSEKQEEVTLEDDGKDSERDAEAGSTEVRADLDVISTLRKYATAYGIEEYLPYLYGILIAESGGTYHPDGGGFMGISDSGGGISIGAEESIKEGCRIFKYCLDHAYSLGCDLETAIQSYNYGPGFADYVAINGGGRYTFRLAEAFAKEKSGGKKVAYKNAISIAANGGWMYQYGCMFYVQSVMTVVNGSTAYLDAELDRLQVPYMDYLAEIPEADIAEYVQLANENRKVTGSSLLTFLLQKNGYLQGMPSSKLFSHIRQIEDYGFKRIDITGDLPVMQYGDIIMDEQAEVFAFYIDRNNAYVCHLEDAGMIRKEPLPSDIQWAYIYTPPVEKKSASQIGASIDLSAIDAAVLPQKLNVLLYDQTAQSAVSIQTIDTTERQATVTFTNVAPNHVYGIIMQDFEGYTRTFANGSVTYVKAEGSDAGSESDTTQEETPAENSGSQEEVPAAEEGAAAQSDG